MAFMYASVIGLTTVWNPKYPRPKSSTVGKPNRSRKMVTRSKVSGGFAGVRRLVVGILDVKFRQLVARASDHRVSPVSHASQPDAATVAIGDCPRCDEAVAVNEAHGRARVA